MHRTLGAVGFCREEPDVELGVVGDESSVAKRPVEVIDGDANGQSVSKIASGYPVYLVCAELAETGNVLSYVGGKLGFDRAVATCDHDSELQHSTGLRIETRRFGVDHRKALGVHRRIHVATVLRGCVGGKVAVTE